jgi:glutamate dehydrogenase/leucine dehydrogenase
VNSRLREKMVKAFGDVIAMKEHTDAASPASKVSLRIAAYMVAIRRVLKVHELRGMYA